MAYPLDHPLTHGMPEARIGARHSRRGRADFGAVPSGKNCAIFCDETMAGDVLKSDEIGINVCLS